MYCSQGMHLVTFEKIIKMQMNVGRMLVNEVNKGLKQILPRCHFAKVREFILSWIMALGSSPPLQILYQVLERKHVTSD